MLDFYYSNNPDPEFPIESDFIASISYADFEKSAEFVDYSRSKKIEFSAHSDFYIEYNLLFDLIEYIKRLDIPKDSIESYQKLSDLLDAGIEANSGIFASCD